MTEYKCGHKCEIIIMDSSVLSYLAWERWKDSVGFDGDKSMCFECWCEKDRKEIAEWKKKAEKDAEKVEK